MEAALKTPSDWILISAYRVYVLCVCSCRLFKKQQGSAYDDLCFSAVS